MGDNGKALYKLINNAVYDKTMDNLRKKIVVRIACNRKDSLKFTSKPSYMSQKRFGNDLKSKFTLKLNKPAYLGMCILDLRKLLIQEFHFEYIKNKYDNNSSLSFTGTYSLIYEMKTMFLKILVRINNCLIFVIIQPSRHIMMAQTNRLMGNEKGGGSFEEFVGLKPGMN